MDNWFKESIDIVTLLAVLLLVSMSAISVHSATYDAGASVVFYRQLMWIGIGLLGMMIVMFLPFRMIQQWSYPMYGVSLALLAAVLILGKTIAGSTSWFGVSGFGLQPSELVKATTVLALATFLSRGNVYMFRFKHIVMAASFVLVPVGLIVLQPDVGTAIIYLGMLLMLMYWSGLSVLFVLAVIAPGAAAIAALFGTTPFLIVTAITFLVLLVLCENKLGSAIVFSLTTLVGVSVQFIFARLAPHQQNRILTFINNEADPLGAGYNVIQAKIAIGSGGFIGKGYLQGSQTQLNFIPAQWTDFIFCVPSEEFGFLGACFVLALLALLLFRGIRIASLAKNKFASIVAIGVVATFTVHIVINIGMCMGIVPVIGVPLPLMSYGGSNMITNLMMVGLLLNMYANRKEY
ncbi:MAG: rod shape-determining protein RodA [Ignavibacteriales bacterium]|nr:rod shape-determining protein RodA [Ignavibacteriales bacterium]